MYIIILFCTMTSILYGYCKEFKLSDSKILLPRTSFLPINYTIRGSSAICHEWISETPEVVSITPLYDSHDLAPKCSHQAIITSVWQSNIRVTGSVYAKNIATGHSVKCDIIIDQIRKLEIETRTLELYLHETPESLIARAYDEYGNTFSTLDGIPFEWLINSNGSNGDGQNVLRFITWTESEYSTPLLIGNLEQQGLQGYMQLVSGLKTGAANVSLYFRDEKLKTFINSNDVRLLVMANAALSPSLAYLIPHTKLIYRINVHSQGSTQEVKLPNDQYYIKVNHTDIGELDEKTSTITAKKYGQTEVILIDRNINEPFRHPSSLIYVVEPGFLTFHISPGENQWVLQSVKENIYTITVRAFDFSSHPIYMSDNIKLKTNIPEAYFQILFSSLNGTYHVVKAIKDGQTKLSSKLMCIILPNKSEFQLESNVEGTQDLIIYPPINVDPRNVILPWYPDNKVIPGYLLTATGGSGEYKWGVFDNNPSISVDMKGHIIPLKPGKSSVIAADQRNLNNRGFSIISVSIISGLQFFLNRVEVEVNNEIDLPIIAIDNNGLKISHCFWLPFKSVSEDPSTIEIIKIISPINSNISESCALLKLRGLKPGFSKITISLPNLQSNKSISNPLSASITIGSFLPTKFIDPFSISSTISVRSIRMMSVVNGPLPWVLDPSQYFFEMHENSSTKKIVKKISFVPQRPNNIFSTLSLQIQCIDIGEVDVTVFIGNKPSLKNPNPVISIGIVKLICTLPVRVKLIPKINGLNFSNGCPFKNASENQQMTINNKDPFAVYIVFTDKNGIQLERSESLAVRVEMKSLNKINIKDIVKESSPNIDYGTSESSSYQIDFPIISTKFYITPNIPGISVGEIEVIVKINSYVEGKGPKLNLEARLHLQLCNSMTVQPEKILLYQHEKVSAKFSINHGSGYFLVTTPNSEFLQINKLEKSSSSTQEALYEIVHTKVDFTQRNGIVNIIDACFNSVEGENENSKAIEIELVKPFKLQLFSSGRVQLGSQINVLIKIYDDTGREFPQDALHFLVLDLHFNDNSNVISANSLHSTDWFISPNEYSDSSGFIFKINGEKLGFESIFVKLHHTTEIFSHSLKIEVFPPLELVPKYTVLLEGAEIQLSTKGGPQNCQELLHYYIVKNNTLKSKEAKIEFLKGPNGLLKAINYGEVSVAVSVEVSDIDPIKNNRIVVLSKDDGRIGVVQIKSLHIWSPTKTLLIGNSMPLWVTFTSSNNDLQHISISGFSISGIGKTDMSFKWNLNPPQGVISKLENILEPGGINIGTKYLHSGMRLTSINPGKQSIELSVSGLPTHWISKDLENNLPLVTKLTIVIIPKLEIISPAIFMKEVLLPPRTRINLKSSLDTIGSVTYTLVPYQSEKGSSKIRSKIYSDNILETSSSLSENERESFILHITSSQTIKLSSSNEIVANQTVALFITVKHPTYSMLSPYISPNSLFRKFQMEKNVNKYYNTFVLPLGGPFDFQITNHDEFGNMFDVSPDTNMFSYRLHRSDNIAITFSSIDSLKKSISTKESLSSNNGQFVKYVDSSSFSSQNVLQFQGLVAGENTIQIFYHDLISDSQKLTDIICIPTDSVLKIKNFPSTYAIEGTRVNFEAPFDNGYWFSFDKDLVSIDSISGYAILKNPGSINVFYSLLNRNIEIDHRENKNVLIGKELVVQSASNLSLKILDGSSLSLEDPCSTNECIPIILNHQSNSLMAVIYISSFSISNLENENNFIFEKEHQLNFSQKLQQEVPLECSVECDINVDSISSTQELCKSLFKVRLLQLPTELDKNIGIKQWGCYVTPNKIDSLTKNELIHLISLMKSDLQLKVKSRLRYKTVMSANILVPVVIGYVLLMNDSSRNGLVIKESGEVLTDIRLALSIATKKFIEENRQIKFMVVSSSPNVLKVLAPREDESNQGIWIYPLKAAVVDKPIKEKVEITIEFPLTKQRDHISLYVDIRGKINTQSSSSSGSSENSDAQALELSQVDWVRPVFCVLITAAIAICIVMLVNQFIQPNVTDEKSNLSPIKDRNWPYYGHSTFHSPLYHPSPKYTQHVWNVSSPRRDNSLLNEYSPNNRKFPGNLNISPFPNFNPGGFGYKANF